MRLCLPMFWLGVGLACAPSIADQATRDGRRVAPDTADSADSDPMVVDTDTSDTAVPHVPVQGQRVIDATDYDSWVGFDLDEGELSDVSQSDWDIALQRYHVKLNGGASGDRDVVAQWVAGTLDEVHQAPAAGWGEDAADDDDDGIPEYLFEDWYLYDSATHVLTPDERVYLIRTGQGAYRKLAIESYYDGVGTPAKVRFRFGELDPPK